MGASHQTVIQEAMRPASKGSTPMTTRPGPQSKETGVQAAREGSTSKCAFPHTHCDGIACSHRLEKLWPLHDTELLLSHAAKTHVEMLECSKDLRLRRHISHVPKRFKRPIST